MRRSAIWVGEGCGPGGRSGQERLPATDTANIGSSLEGRRQPRALARRAALGGRLAFPPRPLLSRVAHDVHVLVHGRHVRVGLLHPLARLFSLPDRLAAPAAANRPPNPPAHYSPLLFLFARPYSHSPASARVSCLFSDRSPPLLLLLLLLLVSHVHGPGAILLSPRDLCLCAPFATSIVVPEAPHGALEQMTEVLPQIILVVTRVDARLFRQDRKQCQSVVSTPRNLTMHGGQL